MLYLAAHLCISSICETFLGGRSGSPGPVVRMKSYPGGGSSPNKTKDRRPSEHSRQSKAENCKHFPESYPPTQDSLLSTYQESDSGIYKLVVILP